MYKKISILVILAFSLLVFGCTDNNKNKVVRSEERRVGKEC